MWYCHLHHLCLRDTAVLEVSLAFLKPDRGLEESSDSVVMTLLKKKKKGKEGALISLSSDANAIRVRVPA